MSKGDKKKEREKREIREKKLKSEEK